jgi:hypothetical protein
MTTGVAEPIDDYQITDRAAFEIRRRHIGEKVVRRVLAAPEHATGSAATIPDRICGRDVPCARVR